MSEDTENILESIQLSPQLSRMIRRDNGGDYKLRWVDGFFRTYINKEDITRNIRSRFNLMIDSSLRIYNRPEELKGTRAFREQIREMLKDIDSLTHADIDVLRQLHVYDVFNTPIKSINKKQIILAKEAK